MAPGQVLDGVGLPASHPDLLTPGRGPPAGTACACFPGGFDYRRPHGQGRFLVIGATRVCPEPDLQGFTVLPKVVDSDG